jgi:flagellar hook-associated protein 3 FlgL
MRITTVGNTLSFMRQISQVRAQLDEAQIQVSTGRKVNTPSDDPGKAGIISQLNNTLGRIGRHQQRIAYSTNLLQQQENIVANSDNIMVRAKEIAQQASNEVMGVDERQILSDEVFALRDTLVSLANSKVQGRYIYGGGEDQRPPYREQPAAPSLLSYTPIDPPYPADGAANKRFSFKVTRSLDDPGTAGVDETYDAADDLRTVKITDNQTVRVNSRGDDVFANSIATLEKLGRALLGADTDTFPAPAPPLPPGAGNSDGTGVAFADYQAQTAALLTSIDEIDTARNDLITERTSLGARLSRVSLAEEILASTKIDVDTSRSLNQDADIFEATAGLAQLQVGLEATLTSGARLNQLTLMDFI